MDHDSYDYKIAHDDFDPDSIYPEIITLGNQLSEILTNHLTSPQEAAIDDFILQTLARMVLPADTSAVLRSRREIIQHAKAAAFMIDQLCIHNQSLSEAIILETHQILTHKIDAIDGTRTWQEYSGTYRTYEVSAGFHAFPAPCLVPSLMKALIREFESDLNEAIKTLLILLHLPRNISITL
ncbi:unnamed protein product [Penicillium glandicola]